MDTRNPQAEQEALLEGHRAGQLEVQAGANPYHLGSPEHAEWERGRSTTEAKRTAATARLRARTAACSYVTGKSCFCGGRGLCLDVA